MVMELLMELDLGDLRLRTLTTKDAALLVEATQAGSRCALWGPTPTVPTRWTMRRPPWRPGIRTGTGRFRSGCCGARGWSPRWA